MQFSLLHLTTWSLPLTMCSQLFEKGKFDESHFTGGETEARGKKIGLIMDSQEVYVVLAWLTKLLPSVYPQRFSPCIIFSFIFFSLNLSQPRGVHT